MSVLPAWITQHPAFTQFYRDSRAEAEAKRTALANELAQAEALTERDRDRLAAQLTEARAAVDRAFAGLTRAQQVATDLEFKRSDVGLTLSATRDRITRALRELADPCIADALRHLDTLESAAPSPRGKTGAAVALAIDTARRDLLALTTRVGVDAAAEAETILARVRAAGA
jgi:hypothetical protein